MQHDLIQVPTEKEAAALTGPKGDDVKSPIKAKHPDGPTAAADYCGRHDGSPGAAPPARYANRLFLLLIAAVSAALFGFQSLEASERAAQKPPPAQGSSERAKFPHDKAKHRTLDCAKCHTITTTKIDVREYPKHAVCVTCHNLALESIARPIAYCGICHDPAELRKPGAVITKSQPALFRFPKPDTASEFGTAFSHPTHLKPGASEKFLINEALNRRGLASQRAAMPPPTCADCHHAQPPTAARQISSDTGHLSCFKCHNEEPLAKPSMYQCAECHKLAGPRSPHLYGLVVDFRHSPDHQFDTRPKKKADLILPRASDYLCAECHKSAASAATLAAIRLPQQNYCSDCHNGKIGLPDPLSKKVLDSLEGH
jgi:hypothetical protein